jgi:hypothetical protein
MIPKPTKITVSWAMVFGSLMSMISMMLPPVGELGELCSLQFRAAYWVLFSD